MFHRGRKPVLPHQCRYCFAMPSVDLPDVEPDPISQLMSTSEHAARQQLLPAAVAQAADFAARMRESLAARWATTDPTLVRLLQRTVTSLAVHEAFVARWSNAILTDETWMELGLDLHRLVRDWADLIDTILPADEPAAA